MRSLPHFYFTETPIIKLEALSEKLQLNLFMKRDDAFSKAQGGNKARKLQYILYKAKVNGCNAVVTAGDINSNHNRATALMCASLGMKCKLVVHNDHPELERLSMNAFICRMSGAELIYCSKADVGPVMDKAMDDFKTDGCEPFYIWGGGHCLEGSYAYYEAAKNAIENFNGNIDNVFFASGTGTTHAGLHVGFKIHSPSTKVLGISIARPYDRGIREIHKSVNELQKFLGKEVSEIDEIMFFDKFIGNSYESIEKDVSNTIRRVCMNEGILLDPTYSGKAFNAMLKTLNNNFDEYQGKNILFWNTGGIFNLLAHRDEI